MPFLREKLEGLEREHRHDTPFRRDFRLPVPSTRKIGLNLIYQSVAAWNDLPLSVRQQESLVSFEGSLMSRLFKN